MDLSATQQNGENLGSGAEQYSMFSNDNPKKPKNFFQKHAMVFLIGAVVAVVVTAAVLFISVTYNKSVTKNSNQQNSSDEQNKDGGNSKPNEEVIVTKGSNNNTITIASSNMTLKVGETGELAVVLTPLNMPNNSYSISIADPSIISASVNKENNNVSITAKKYGTTSITLTLQDGGASAKTDVRVVSPDTVIYYRYRDKSTTTAKVPTLPGWTFDYKEETWGDWGAWSDWSQTQPTAKEARDIEWKQTTTATGKYDYYRYICKGEEPGNGSLYAFRVFAAPTNCNQADYGNKNIQNTGLYDGNNKDEIYNTVLNSAGISIGGQTVYKSDSDSCTSSDQLGCWFRGNAVTVLATMWRYRDATKVTTYYFYQYTAWSDWSTEPAYASNVREVQVKQ